MRNRRELETLVEVLDSERRRFLLRHVHEHGPCTLEAVATAVFEAERDGTRPTTEPDEFLQILFELRDDHLPELLDHDLVDYDPDGEIVEATVTADLLFACADAVSDPDVETPVT